jgi:type II secretory pathway pseudopilin PulG
MGQQQLLLIILGVIIVGIAIAVGLSLFSAQSIQSNKDAIINDLNNIAAQAYQFKVRPSSMGGGQGAYTGFTIPTKMATNENATYVSTAAAASVTVVATSAQNTTNKVTGIVDSDGKLGGWTYAGDFQ